MDTKEQTETSADTIKSMNRYWTAGWNEQAFRHSTSIPKQER